MNSFKLPTVLMVFVLLVPVEAPASPPCPPPTPTWRHVDQSALNKLIAAHEEWLKTQEKTGSRADLQNADISGLQAIGRNLELACLNGATLDRTDLSRSILTRAELQRASMTLTKLTGARLAEAKMNYAALEQADLVGTNLWKAELSYTTLWQTNFTQADLSNAVLRDADLIQTNLTGARLYRVDLTGASYRAATAPAVGYLAGIQGLDTVKLEDSDYSGAVQLRAALRSAGLNDLERQLTYSIERWRTRDLTTRWIRAPFSNFMAGVYAVLRTVFLDRTTAYGLRPGQALELLFAIWVLGTIVYLVPVVRGTGPDEPRSGLFRLGTETAVQHESGRITLTTEPHAIPVHGKRFRDLFWAPYFSLISTFNIGFREIQVGGWIRRIQPNDFELRPIGWVRIASGFQSLASLYLLAIWLLTYFGHPFE